VVHLIGELLGVSVGHIEASAIDESSQLVLGNHAIAVKVASEESIVEVEAWK